MSIKEYLKDRITFIIINIVLFIIVSGLMKFAHVSNVIIFLVFCIWFMPFSSYIIIELIKNKVYYDEMKKVLDSLDKKYLLPEVIKKPDFIEGKLVYEILSETEKYMHECVNEYRDMQQEYREYIETWVHEIKTPIASARLIIDNNKNVITQNIESEIKRVEGYIEQVLYYSRSTDVSKDYIIKEFQLKQSVMNTVKRNSRDFINKKISIDINNVKGTVYSDIKWVEFILNQIIGNSIKYSKGKEGKIEIYSTINNNNVVLSVKDNGIGIEQKDMGRVFHKGFTGENGRKFGKSTGIGLYLCNKLCNKLGLGINITSKFGVGTIVDIIFPLGKFTSL
ncbi:sensor histidine kinase [Clostridium botulinum]|uniref:histidine kinase n=2 Tax=Clostridium botulinum TaxID=1491 RepID=A0A9Q1UZT6_CLOBO|nr:sensor histidine kinase [Clostridium botulinum]AEB75147.1 integral membrane sensor signal transduction histidine kinase [Clostridium botulinum BKT015925]KEI00512.1 histidine kinase [Clostridium botulinum C/D str. Sp77]KEI01891.1 histidine kinase [Clostridium botulinum D str. 16868]KLU74866.1 histidine kinase [Clostridium botulinum V891]KOA77183.1 histidine kinase [Clostridium botulinum]